MKIKCCLFFVIGLLVLLLTLFVGCGQYTKEDVNRASQEGYDTGFTAGLASTPQDVNAAYRDGYNAGLADGLAEGKSVEPEPSAEAISEPEPEIPAITPEAPTSLSPIQASVIRVIDGDTIEVNIQGQPYRVRYIGIDTPEVGQSYADKATRRNRLFVQGKVVWLEKDVSETDKYGRLLRYVYVKPPTLSELAEHYDTSLEETREFVAEFNRTQQLGDRESVLVNAELVRLGYAQVATYPPDVKHQAYFLELQREAQEADRGCWYTPEPAPIVPEASGKYVGSINSNIYHYPSCIWAKKIKPQNEIWFATANDADAHGYRPCKVCDPTPPHSPWAELEEVERFKELFK